MLQIDQLEALLVTLPLGLMFVERHYPIVRDWFANQFNEIKVQKWVQSNPIIQTKSVLQHNHNWKTVCWLSVTPLEKSKSERDKRSNTQNCTEIRTQKNNSYILDSTSNMHKKHKQYDRFVSKTLCMYLKSLISLSQLVCSFPRVLQLWQAVLL